MGYFITKTKNALLATLNREGARAGELLEQGTVCYLNESDGRLYACRGSEDVPIGITAQAYNEGALVKLIYTGITYVPKSKVSVQVGDTLYVGENGQLSSEGPLVVGYVVEDDQEHYTVNLTAFGTEIAEGGGGGGSNAVYGEVEFVSPPFASREIGINESLFGKTLMIPVDVSEISEEAIKSNGLMIVMGTQYLDSIDKPVGTKIDLSYTVHAEVPDGTLLGVIGNQNTDGSGGFATGSVVFYNSNAPVYFYQESATINVSLYRVNTTGGDGAPPLDGWFGVVNNNSQPNQLGGDSRVYRYYDSGSLTEEDTWTLPDDHITNIINVGYFGGTVRVGGDYTISPYLNLPHGKVIKTTFITENGIFFEANDDVPPGTRGEVLLQMPAGSSKHRNADLYMMRYISDTHPDEYYSTSFDGWIAWVNGDAGGKGSFDIYNEAHWSTSGENLSIDEGMNELAERLHAAEGTISTLSSTIATLNSTISGLTSRIGALEEQNLNSRLTAIEDDTIPSLDSRVTALEGA